MSANASGPWQFVPARDQRDLTVRASAPTMPQPGHGREVHATPGWPPVAIPGRPGWYRHHINGRQEDLPGDQQAGGGQ